MLDQIREWAQNYFQQFYVHEKKTFLPIERKLDN